MPCKPTWCGDWTAYRLTNLRKYVSDDFRYMVSNLLMTRNGVMLADVGWTNIRVIRTLRHCARQSDTIVMQVDSTNSKTHYAVSAGRMTRETLPD